MAMTIAQGIDDAIRRTPLIRLSGPSRATGLFLGSASGVNVAGAMQVARQLGAGHAIVPILCDGGQKYQSRLYSPMWLEEKGLATAAATTAW